MIQRFCTAVACLAGLSGFAQWPTQVVDHQFGTGQTFGQGPEYFPANVLGPVVGPATPGSAVADPLQVVSLGKNGFVTLAFSPAILDGLGADFTVFENPFSFGVGQVYDEWLLVEVSVDGQNWVTFPYDSTTGQGLAGRTPTAPQGTDLTDPAVSGGDTFDLAVLGLAQVNYVRLADRTRWQTDRLATEAAEVDGVVALHTPLGQQEATLASAITLRQAKQQLTLESKAVIEQIQVFDITGRSLWAVEPQRAGAVRVAVGSSWPEVLLIRAETPLGVFFRRVLVSAG